MPADLLLGGRRDHLPRSPVYHQPAPTEIPKRSSEAAHDVAGVAEFPRVAVAASTAMPSPPLGIAAPTATDSYELQFLSPPEQAISVRDRRQKAPSDPYCPQIERLENSKLQSLLKFNYRPGPLSLFVMGKAQRKAFEQNEDLNCQIHFFSTKGSEVSAESLRVVESKCQYLLFEGSHPFYDIQKITSSHIDACLDLPVMTTISHGHGHRVEYERWVARLQFHGA